VIAVPGPLDGSLCDSAVNAAVIPGFFFQFAVCLGIIQGVLQLVDRFGAVGFTRFLLRSLTNSGQGTLGSGQGIKSPLSGGRAEQRGLSVPYYAGGIGGLLSVNAGGDGGGPGAEQTDKVSATGVFGTKTKLVVVGGPNEAIRNVIGVEAMLQEDTRTIVSARRMSGIDARPLTHPLSPEYEGEGVALLRCLERLTPRLPLLPSSPQPAQW
jgi:hypothetical protein